MTHLHRSHGGLGRRQFLAGGAALPLLGALAATGAAFDQPEATSQDKDAKPLGIPGPYPGRVIEVRNPAMIKDGVKSRAAIQATLARGLQELTGAEDAVQAWRTFFEPGDVVGIKVVPNGYPLAHSSHELVLEVIEGLKSAGVKPRDMVVFDRYKSEFIQAKYPEILPDGILWGGLTPADDETQLEITFPGHDPVAGYDPDEFMQMNLIHAGHDPKDDRNLRSHLGLLVTRRVNKLVLLPCLKDHGAAGVTGALKNMSHGLVNNVARSHSSPHTNACNQFIPQVVSHPILRQKCVLHIMDGLRGVFQGGPFAPVENIAWTWEYNALLLATDPVALDHVEWDIIDAQRKARKLPPVGAVGQLGLDADREGFDIRQPQHIALAANLGLGIFDYKSPRGRRHSIQHRIINIG
jgi:hypothetical protein